MQLIIWMFVWMVLFKKEKKTPHTHTKIHSCTTKSYLHTCKLLATLWFQSVSSFLVTSTNSAFCLNCILHVPVYFFLRYLLFSTIDGVNQKDLVVYSTTNFLVASRTSNTVKHCITRNALVKYLEQYQQSKATFLQV